MTRESTYIMYTGKSLTEGGDVLTQVTLEMSRVCKTRGKGTAHEHCTLADKVVSHMEAIAVQTPLLMCSGTEQVSK